MTDTDTITPDRLAAVEAELERLRTAQERQDAGERAKTAYLPAPPKPSEFASAQIARQERARQARQAALQAQSDEYERRLERNAPHREQLRAELADLDSRLGKERARFEAAAAKIAAERQAVTLRLATLEAMPPAPAPDVEPARCLRCDTVLDVARRRCPGCGAKLPVPLAMTRGFN